MSRQLNYLGNKLIGENEILMIGHGGDRYMKITYEITFLQT